MTIQLQLVLVLLFVADTAVCQNQSSFCNSTFDKIVFIKSGSYVPFSKEAGESAKVYLKSFYLEEHLVTNEEFLRFVRANPSWRKSKVKSIFADRNYLKNWNNDLKLGKNVDPSAPVTYLSWFAARAYCKWIGGRLPTTDEWEYATKKKSADLVRVSNVDRVIWEWTEDFNSILLTDSHTDDGNSPSVLSCGGSSVNVNDPKNYSAFLRYSFRSSLKANYCIPNLSFRCAYTPKHLHAKKNPSSGISAYRNVNTP